MTHGSVKGINLRQSTVSGGKSKKKKDVEGGGGWVQSLGWPDMNPAMPVHECLREVECAEICRMSSLPCE
jgi:hypothetical protein